LIFIFYFLLFLSFLSKFLFFIIFLFIGHYFTIIITTTCFHSFCINQAKININYKFFTDGKRERERGRKYIDICGGIYVRKEKSGIKYLYVHVYIYNLSLYTLCIYERIKYTYLYSPSIPSNSFLFSLFILRFSLIILQYRYTRHSHQ
jgi:hypothetical protein